MGKVVAYCSKHRLADEHNCKFDYIKNRDAYGIQMQLLVIDPKGTSNILFIIFF